MADISALVAAVRIQGIRLVESSLKTDIAAPPDKPVEAEIGHKSSVVRRSDKDGSFLIRADFTFSVKEDDGKAPVSVKASFELQYQLPADLKPASAELEEFGKSNAIFNAWPYWREYLQSALVRMGLPAFTLPVYRLPAGMSEPKKKAKAR